jgi:hypothetical protein
MVLPEQLDAINDLAKLGEWGVYIAGWTTN